MKTVWNVFVDCFRRLKGNIVAVVIMSGLVLMPSLYAWFSLLAFWNPEASTGNLDVAVVNDDAGYSSELLPMPLHAGDRVVDALRANDQLHWVFVNKDEAVNGVKSGAYYAALVIPDDFSRDLATAFSSAETTPSIEFYVNEKENPIAPHVTSIGASTVQKDIDQAFAQTISTVALETGSNVARFMDGDGIAQYAQSLQRQLSSSADELSADADLARTFAALLGQTRSLVDSSSQGLAKSGAVADSVAPLVDQTKAGLAETDKGLSGLAGLASQGVADGKGAIEAMKGSVNEAFASMKNDPAAVRSLVTSLQNDVASLRSAYGQASAALSAVDPSSPLIGQLKTMTGALDTLDATLGDTLASIDAGASDAESERAAVTQALDKAAQTLGDAQTSYVDTLKNDAQKLGQSLGTLGQDAQTVAADLKSASTSVAEAGSSVADGMGEVQSALNEAATLLSDASASMDKNAEKLSGALARGDLDEVRAIVGSDPANLASVLSAPTAVNKIAVYGVANYGSAMSPFYTSLALFVGSLFLAIILKTDLSPARQKALGDPKPHQAFLGVGLFFLVVALAQAALLLTGNLFFLQVQCDNVALYYLTGLLTTTTFLSIIYALVVVFGDVGKALAMILLVLQVAGSGGELPIQLSSAAFQAVYPWLPFVHTMNMFQGAMAGVYGNQYLMSSLALLAYLAGALVLGLALRKPLMRLTGFVNEKLEQTKLL